MPAISASTAAIRRNQRRPGVSTHGVCQPQLLDRFAADRVDDKPHPAELVDPLAQDLVGSLVHVVVERVAVVGHELLPIVLGGAEQLLLYALARLGIAVGVEGRPRLRARAEALTAIRR